MFFGKALDHVKADGVHFNLWVLGNKKFNLLLVIQCGAIKHIRSAWASKWVKRDKKHQLVKNLFNSVFIEQKQVDPELLHLEYYTVWTSSLVEFYKNAIVYKPVQRLVKLLWCVKDTNHEDGLVIPHPQQVENTMSALKCELQKWNRVTMFKFLHQIKYLSFYAWKRTEVFHRDPPISLCWHRSFTEVRMSKCTNANTNHLTEVWTNF